MNIIQYQNSFRSNNDMNILYFSKIIKIFYLYSLEFNSYLLLVITIVN